jgi:hypothetical protein
MIDLALPRRGSWLERQDALSVKTRNEYLGHATAFVNWAIREGRLVHNPLKSVVKEAAKGNETFRRRALTVEQFVELSSAKAGPAGFSRFLRGASSMMRWGCAVFADNFRTITANRRADTDGDSGHGVPVPRPASVAT